VNDLGKDRDDGTVCPSHEHTKDEYRRMKHDSFNESIEMYLKTMSELAPPGEDVAISSLARRLGVSTVSATEMVHRLEDQGMVIHTPYRGVRLTGEGSEFATRIKRSHQLWERFLSDHLKLSWASVHDLACILEHATEDTVTEALAAYLGHPTTCPHGNPIPALDGTIAEPPLISLNELEVGAEATIRAIRPESTMLLEHLARYNLKPGQNIRVVEIAPFNGPFLLAVGSETQPIGREVATHIYVERA
jgi:DtxR family transcriptional regulator, Mn-dependent transcriptional regulator